MSITWEYYAPDLAYISLTHNRSRGFVKDSVDLGDLAEVEGVKSLNSIVLDFDSAGRLVGIEIRGNADKVLPRDLLAERGHDETGPGARAETQHRPPWTQTRADVDRPPATPERTSR